MKHQTAEKGTGGFMRPELILKQFKIDRGWKIGDFGSGSGYFTILLAQMVGPEGRVWAFDVLNEALEAVRSRAKMMGVGNIEYVRANLEVAGSTKLADQTLDISLLANILFQSQKKQEIIKEAVRALKSKGMLIIIDWNKDSGIGHHEKGWQISPQEAKQIIDGLDEPLKLIKEFEAGQYHWGLIYQKT